MASPQKEDGYTAIANEIMDALMKCCPGGSEGQVLMCVIRKTYGWQKKQDAISISQLSEATNLSRRAVIYAIQNLEAKNMIIVSRANSQINTISFQKDYELWRPDAVSEQWARQLQLKRERYHQKVVQRIDDDVQISALPSQTQNSEFSALPSTIQVVQRIDEGSAENCKKVVQRIVKNSQFSAPTKEIKKYTKETIQKKKEFRVENYPVPEWIDADLWISYMEVREKKKAVQSEQALKLILSDLTRYHEEGQDVNEILRRSIKGSWKDVYSLKDKPTGSGPPKSRPQPQRVTARTEEYSMEEYYEGLK